MSTKINIETKYYDLDLGHKTIQFRKWKSKDRKAFKKTFKSNESNEQNVLDILVKGCLKDPDIDLSFDELQYVFIKIREASISDTVTFNYTCPCNKKNTAVLKINDIIRFTFSEFKDIKVDNLEFKIGPVKNSQSYNAQMINPEFEDIADLVDFAFHVEKINNSEDFTLMEVIEMLDDLDTDILDKILDEYDTQRFKLDTVNVLTCSCGIKDKWLFDELPEFFPEDWIER